MIRYVSSVVMSNCLVIFHHFFSKEGEGVKTISRKLSSFPMAWVTASPTKSSGWALSVWFCPVFSLYSGSALRGSPLLLVLCQKLATYLHHFALTWFLRHIGDFSNGVHTITLDSDQVGGFQLAAHDESAYLKERKNEKMINGERLINKGYFEWSAIRLRVV